MKNIEKTLLEMINHLINNHPELTPIIKSLIDSQITNKLILPKFTDITLEHPTRNQMYDFMNNFFINNCPDSIKAHRHYFKTERRGFGEDAFHSMWLLLLNEFKPNLCLEIGVYRGQVITLWGIISSILDFPNEIHGISPFSSAGDADSQYIDGLDYFTDTLNSNTLFNLPTPKLLKAFSTEPLAKAYIQSQKWDLIYIDGSHDYDVALSDYEISIRSLTNGGLLVMDDSSLYTEYKPNSGSFAGHPGPSKIVNERAMHDLKFIGSVGHNNIFQNTN